MSQKFSRRDFALKAASVTAGIVAAPLLSAQEKPEQKPPVRDTEVDEVQSKLSTHLTDAERKIVKDNLSSQISDEKKRLAMKILENSEPCFTYIPVGYGKKGGE